MQRRRCTSRAGPPVNPLLLYSAWLGTAATYWSPARVCRAPPLSRAALVALSAPPRTPPWPRVPPPRAARRPWAHTPASVGASVAGRERAVKTQDIGARSKRMAVRQRRRWPRTPRAARGRQRAPVAADNDGLAGGFRRRRERS
uniref:Uncharacterized protein n=1 Tax=Arundo donax TaxID=35708 RepID=A0A0A9BYR9_ARUDO